MVALSSQFTPADGRIVRLEVDGDATGVELGAKKSFEDGAITLSLVGEAVTIGNSVEVGAISFVGDALSIRKSVEDGAITLVGSLLETVGTIVSLGASEVGGRVGEEVYRDGVLENDGSLLSLGVRLPSEDVGAKIIGAKLMKVGVGSMDGVFKDGERDGMKLELEGSMSRVGVSVTDEG